jgi:hypothetical protein
MNAADNRDKYAIPTNPGVAFRHAAVSFELATIHAECSEHSEVRVDPLNVRAAPPAKCRMPLSPWEQVGKTRHQS